MHIPNGFLTDPVCTVSTLAAAAAVGAGFARLRQTGGARSAGLVAATGAGIFAAQMVNFPIDQGTSGHVLGAALAAIVLGPWCGMLAMTVVVLVQLLFGDGGTTTLGANVLNMAVVGTLTASLLYTLSTRYLSGPNGKLLGAAAAALGSVLAAAGLCSLELAASGRFEPAEVFGRMMGVHALIGIGEALVTLAIVAAVLAAGSHGKWLSGRRAIAGALAVAVVVAGLIAPLASTAPDGLERVAQDLNFANLASHDSWAIAPDYAAPGIAWPALAVALAGIGGVAIVAVGNYIVSRTAMVKVRQR
jgi:cobalt/nickel transport system permease protein